VASEVTDSNKNPNSAINSEKNKQGKRSEVVV
jgi:hypothetical protein